MTVHTCGRPDCARKHHAKGLCKLHWRRDRAPQRPRRAPKPKPASAAKQSPPAQTTTRRAVTATTSPPAKPITKLREVPPSRPLTQEEKDLTMRLLHRYNATELAEMLGMAA